MHNRTKQQGFKNATEQPDLPAGDFSAWLRHTRNALLTDSGTEVDCGDCVGCCSSFYFIHIRPHETLTLARIPAKIPVAAPGLPKGNVLLGYDKKGLCPLLINNKCSIYEHRPLTCRNYDCRVFAAAGLVESGDKPRITQRIQQWKFSYPEQSDRDEHLAVQAAAKFISENAECFPGGKIPGNPSQLAILAIKVYTVFLENEYRAFEAGSASLRTELANAIVEACGKFDAARASVSGANRAKGNPAQGVQGRRGRSRETRTAGRINGQ